jgi:hypothetical protein
MLAGPLMRNMGSVAMSIAWVRGPVPALGLNGVPVTTTVFTSGSGPIAATKASVTKFVDDGFGYTLAVTPAGRGLNEKLMLSEEPPIRRMTSGT